MLTETISIKIKHGMHLRPASELCEVANANPLCKISVIHKNKIINVNSLLDIQKAKIQQGDEVTIVVSGPNEEKIMDIILTDLEYWSSI